MGLIGLGNMGTAIAERLLDGGYDLVVSNRTPGRSEALEARGASVASTPRRARRAGRRRPHLARRRRGVRGRRGAPSSMPRGRAPSSSTCPRSRRPSSARVAERAEERSVRYLRAPVSGNPTVVRAGNLSFIVSGDARGAGRDRTGAPRDRADDPPRGRRRAGPSREACDQPDDRRARAGDVGGPRLRRGGRRESRRAPRGDGQLGRRRAVREVQDRAAAPRRLLGDVHDGVDGEGHRPRARRSRRAAASTCLWHWR